MIFRHSLAKACAVFIVVLFCAVPVRAQLLAGYHSVELVGSDDFEPLLLADGGLESIDVQQVENTLETASYSNFLTSPVSDNEAAQAPLDIEADSMRYVDDGRVVSAQGNVIIEQDGRILRADEVEYAIDADSVRARGNVVLNEENGDIHLSQSVAYNNALKDGSVDDLKTTLADGSRFTANSGKREEGVRTIMNGATYTACSECRDDDGSIKRLPWQIKASEVEHDEEDARISYRNARFNVYGVAVAYTPYFSHPDGTVTQKSGFLSPSFGYKSDLGAFVENSYYWGIAPDKDATFGLVAYTDQAPMGLVEYRQRWGDANIVINGGATYSERTDNEGGDNVEIAEEFRGHIFADGLWEINDKWRSGVKVEYVHDEQYANQYDITDQDVLQNSLYAERFSDRDYAQGSVQLYKDIRASDRRVDQPGVLPEIYASFIGNPGAVPIVKGRWDASVGLLSLFRDGAEQDVMRGSVDLGWERRLISDYGLVSDIDLTLRGDAYYVNDSDGTTTTSGRDSDTIETRFFPQLHAQASYPVARNFEKAQLTLAPIVSLTASPKNNSNDDVPNEDSQDVQIDSSNLFEPNRFPGLDVVEDQSRVTYGLRTGLNGYKNSNAEFFIGQSYRLDEDNNPFRDGSGLSDRNSDIVGYLNANYKNTYNMQYRYQLNNQNLSPERHELDAYADWNRFRVGVNYLYAQPLEGTDIDETREQLGTNAQYYINNKWRVALASQYDLGVDPGLRTAGLGIDYFGQCVSWGLEARRNLTDDSSGDSDTEVLFRIGLRNISEFMQTGLRDEGNSP